MKKRIFSILMALMMVLALVPVSIFAEDTVPVGCGSYSVTVAAGEMKCFTFTPEEDGYYEFYTTGEADTRGVLHFNEEGDEIDADDGGEGGNFKIVAYQTAGRNYDLSVSAYSDSEESFTLVIEKHTTHEYTRWDNADGYDEELGEEVIRGHYCVCAFCGLRTGEPEAHTYDGGICTACGAVDPNHEIVVRYWANMDGYDEELGRNIVVGHQARCRVCGCIHGDTRPHEYDAGICMVCGAVNPEHEHVYTRWDNGDYYDEELGKEVIAGHYHACATCGIWTGEPEPHTYVDDVCTVCGAADPDHECVSGGLERYTRWDSEIEEEIDYGHAQRCRICGKWLSKPEPHTYENGRCMDCGAEDPGYIEPVDPREMTVSGTASLGETVIGIPDGDMVYYMFTPAEDGLYRFTSAGEEDTYAELFGSNRVLMTSDDDGGENSNFSITADLIGGETYYIGVKFYAEMSGEIALLIEKHTHVYVDGRCVCGEIDPDHQCVEGEWVSFDYYDEETDEYVYGHAIECAICGCKMSETKPHTYKGAYCTVCGALDPDHEHVCSWWELGWGEVDGEWMEGHIAYCDQCKMTFGEYEAHSYVGNYCEKCGVLNPGHEHVLGGWMINSHYDESLHTYIDEGTDQRWCALCKECYGEPVPHEFKNDICIHCGNIDPGHTQHDEGVWDRVWGEDYVGHARYCTVCGQLITGTEEEHTYDPEYRDGNYCTVCGAPNPDHECVVGYWIPYGGYDVEAHAYVQGHKAICAICDIAMPGTETEHTFDHGRCIDCGIDDYTHKHDFIYNSDLAGHATTCRICNYTVNCADHTFDANGVCTVCGWIKDKPTEIAVSENENKDLILNITFADDTTREQLVVTDLYFTWGGKMTDGRQYNSETIYTADRILGPEYYFVTEPDGRFYVCYDFFGINPVYSNALSGGSEWFTVYQAAANENITGFTLSRDEYGVWTADGTSYDGWNVIMTLDGDGTVLSYASAAMYDVNDDGFIDKDDLTLLVRHVAKIEVVEDEYLLSRLDIDGDGVVNAIDIATLASVMDSVTE